MNGDNLLSQVTALEIGRRGQFVLSGRDTAASTLQTAKLTCIKHSASLFPHVSAGQTTGSSSSSSPTNSATLPPGCRGQATSQTPCVLMPHVQSPACYGASSASPAQPQHAGSASTRLLFGVLDLPVGSLRPQALTSIPSSNLHACRKEGGYGRGNGRS